MVEAVVPDAHFSSTEPLMIGEPIAAVPVVLTETELLPADGELPSLPPPPHAVSAAHMAALSASLVIPVLSLSFMLI
ncbi:hypothetical protein D2W70_21675 [Burkholderia pseudomallei]|nr:hypothetical protein D2W70_21675 [Burkholderia pseudomallei]RIV63816.1 hypothetical protein D2W49_08780 [Burkholderia pseudomallei]